MKNKNLQRGAYPLVLFSGRSNLAGRFFNILPVPRAPEKEDLNVRELLCRADSAGPVSPTCFDV